MSNPAAPSQTSPPINPKFGLMLTAADLLTPIFMGAAMGDALLAGEMALTGIEDYQPTTRADYVNLARTIVFSMSSIALLGHAASADMAMAERMRAFGRANALSRSADQSERTMMQRRQYQQANPPATNAGSGVDPAPDAPTPDLAETDSELQASIADAMKEYLAVCRPAGTEDAADPRPVPKEIPAQAAPSPKSGLITAIEPPGPSATRYAGVSPGFAEPRTTPDGRPLHSMTASHGRTGKPAPA